MSSSEGINATSPPTTLAPIPIVRATGGIISGRGITSSPPPQNQFERTTSEKVKRVAIIALLGLGMATTVATMQLSCACLTVLSAQAAAIGLSPALCVGAIIIGLIAFAILCKKLDQFVSVDTTFFPILSRDPEGAALIATAQAVAKKQDLGEFIIRIESTTKSGNSSEIEGNIIRIKDNISRKQQLIRTVIELNTLIQLNPDSFPETLKNLVNDVYETAEDYAKANAKIKYDSLNNKEAMLAILTGGQAPEKTDFETFYTTTVEESSKRLYRKSWNQFQEAPASTRFAARILANILY